MSPNDIRLNDIIKVYEEEISKNTKNKHGLTIFENFKMVNFCNILKTLKSGNYNGGDYNIFIISEPKHRIVMSLSVKDKIINHYITRYILEPKLTKFLDYRNVATRKGMGTDFGIRLIRKFLEKNKKYDKFYILKLDIKKYYYSIDHEVLKCMIKDILNDFEYKLVCGVIDSTDNEKIVEKTEYAKLKYLKTHPKMINEINDLPLCEKGKALSIGALTSQFLGMYYLHELDFFIIHKLGLPCYVRYQDDMIIMSKDKDKLELALSKITEFLNDKLKLKLNDNKTKIVTCDEGFNFLGYKFRVINKKTVMSLRKETFFNIKKRIKEIKYLCSNNYISEYSAFSSINALLYNHKYSGFSKVKRAIKRYFYE